MCAFKIKNTNNKEMEEWSLIEDEVIYVMELEISYWFSFYGD